MPGQNTTQAEGSSSRKLSEHDSYLQFYSHFGQTGKPSTLLGTGSSREKVLQHQPIFPGDILQLRHGAVRHWGPSPP